MKNTLEALSKFRNYLTKNCKNINIGKSPVLVFISMIGGAVLTAVSALFASKTILGCIGIGVGALIAIVNAIQLIYKKYI